MWVIVGGKFKTNRCLDVLFLSRTECQSNTWGSSKHTLLFCPNLCLSKIDLISVHKSFLQADIEKTHKNEVS